VGTALCTRDARCRPNTLFFTAGINDEADGLLGTIVPNG